MPKLCYVPKRFTPEWMRVVNQANSILEGYWNANITITLRTLYYRFVAGDLFPDSRKWSQKGGRWVRDKRGTKNAEPNYKWLGGIISEARLAGLIDWDYLEDRTRNIALLQHYDGAQDALNKLVNWYHVDMWRRQQWRPEVWIEKDAQVGVIQAVCDENDVPYFSCRGYTSLSEMWRASMRLRRHLDNGQMPYIIHFGDHDPSGIDMSRDIMDRLKYTFMSDYKFHRVALNMDQIETYNPPPNPAKVTDSRYESYRELYGDESWELDSLEPTEFRGLIESHINRIRDETIWGEDVAEREATRSRLKKVSEDWDKSLKKPTKPRKKRKPK